MTSDSKDKHCQKRIVYKTFNYPNSTTGEKTLLTGIRGKTDSEKVYISGFYVPQNSEDTTGFVYYGHLNGKGKFYNLNYPNVNDVKTITNLYGPNNGACENKIQVVGSYTIQNEKGTFGCLYEGPLDGSGKWTTIVPTPLSADKILNTICHSTMGNLIVGNYDTILVQGKAFIYDIKTKKYYKITNPEAISITAYGIWHNNSELYTICGGYTNKEGTNFAYVVDWNNKTHKFSNWQTYNYNNNECIKITHFDGITGGCDENTYNLTGDWLNDGKGSGFYAQIKFNPKENKFNKNAKWYDIKYPNQAVTSGNSVYENYVIGVYTNLENNSVDGYIAKLENFKL
jgi:hypothetical protein